MRSISFLKSLGLAFVAALLLASAASAHLLPASGMTGGAWETIDTPGLAGQRITAVLPMSASSVWVGTEERGLAHWNGKAWRMFGSADGLPDNRVVALAADRRGHIWASTATGLVYLSSSGSAVRRVPLAGMSALPILALAEAQDGGLLLGGPAGLAIWQADGALQLAPEFAGKRVLAVQTGRDGTSWVGTSAGLWRSAATGWRREESVKGAVTAIAESPDGLLIVTSAAGVWRLREGAWDLLRAAAPGVTRATIRDGAVWLGGAQGLSAGQGEVWQVYDPRALPAAQVTALAWAPDSRLWIGTVAGLAVHVPNTVSPTIAITSINGVSAGRGSIELATDRVERIGLAAQDDATASEALHRFVRLEGVDDAPRLLTPNEQRDSRDITVYREHRLPAGSYVLRAWAQDDAFNRSPEARVTLTVPAFAYVPGGVKVRREAAYVGLAGLALVLTAGAASRSAVRARRRHVQRAAQAVALRIRAVSERSSELYTQPLPLREEQVQEALVTLPRQSVLLLGEAGIGKTTMLGQIADAATWQPDPAVLLLHAPVDLTTLSEVALFHGLMGAAIEGLHTVATGEWPHLRWNGASASAYGEPEFSADLGLLMAWLQPQLTGRLILAFLVDNAAALDRYGGGAQDAFRRLVLASSAATAPVRLVLAAEQTPLCLQGVADLLHIQVLAPLDQEAAVQLLHEGAGGLLAWDLDAQRRAVELGAGSPATLAALGRAAARTAVADSRLRVIATDVP